MPTAYIVTSGEYSDYGINWVFLDKDLAEAAARRVSPNPDEYGAYRVEEYEIREALPEIRDRLSLSCDVHPDGTVTPGVVGGEQISPEVGREEWPDCESRVYAITGLGRDHVTVYVHGFDHDRVRKRYSEAVAQAKAEAHLIIAAAIEERRKWAAERPSHVTWTSN